MANPRRKRRVRRRKNTWFEGKTRDSKTGKLVARKHQKVARGGFRKSDRQRSWRDALKQASKDLTVKGPWKRSKRKKKVVGRGSHAEVSERAVSLYSYSPMTAAEKRKQRKRKDAARRSKTTSSKSRKSKSPRRTAPKRQAPALQPYVKGNPMRRRKNAKMQPIQKLMNWTKMVQDRVEKVPVARYVAWAIPAAALGWGVYYIHTAAAPKLVPALEKAPFVGGWVGRNPYLSTALVLGPALGFIAKKGYLNKTAAMTVATAAVAIGVVLDKSSSQAAIADVGGFGDGMRYLIGKSTQALGPLSAYEDASMADAAACPAEMSDHEVSAALSGQYENCFPPSPHRSRTKGTQYSRHAGSHGHRYGWLIKLIGPARFHELAKLPPKQRAEIIQALKVQALSTLSGELQATQQYVESAAMPIDGTANGAQGFESATYGALMYAGGGA